MVDARTEMHDPQTAECLDVSLLNKIASRISSSAPLEAVLQDVVEFVTSVVKCDSCFVYLLEEGDLVLRASGNPHPEWVNRLKLKLGQGITGWVAEHREPVAVGRDASQDPRFKAFSGLPEDHFEAFLSVPIVSGGKLVGVINAQNRAPHHYSPREISLTATVGYMVGAEVDRARLESANSVLSARLESRKIVERAKGILQREMKITEEDAYRAMQRESQQKRKSMKDIADAIILIDGIKQLNISQL
jgi:uroporphyrinogen-III synthase